MEICDSSICTGCGTCVQKCPKNCITLSEDERGFLNPVIDEEKCVNCGICKKYCPALALKVKKNKIKSVYKCSSKNSKLIQKSTSGGIVFELSKYIVKNLRGVFFGAQFAENIKVIHTYTADESQLYKHQGSKYIQSNTLNTYKETENFLKQGKTVLYVGTPCQIAGLKTYLEKEYDNLYTVDFICHGVGSSEVFRLDAEMLICGYSISDIKNISFRNKKDGYRNGKLQVEAELNNGKVLSADLSGKGFGYGFATDLITRDSCVKCKYIGLDRFSDITVADYPSEDMSEYEKKNGCSFVLINTEKGQKLFESCSDEFNIEKKTLDFAIDISYHLTKKSNINPKKEKFFEELKMRPFEKLEKKYLTPRKNNIVNKTILYLQNKVRSRRTGI